MNLMIIGWPRFLYVPIFVENSWPYWLHDTALGNCSFFRSKSAYIYLPDVCVSARLWLYPGKWLTSFFEVGPGSVLSGLHPSQQVPQDLFGLELGTLVQWRLQKTFWSNRGANIDIRYAWIIVKHCDKYCLNIYIYTCRLHYITCFGHICIFYLIYNPVSLSLEHSSPS